MARRRQGRDVVLDRQAVRGQPWAIATANRLYVGQALYIPAGSSYPRRGGCGSYHTVQRGDTLYRIGIAYKVSPWSIASANRIYNMNYILVGQRLFIPCY